MDFLVLLLLLLQLGLTRSIEVSPSSPCAPVCLDKPDSDPSNPQSSSTMKQDLICSDTDYDTTLRGQKMKACLSCELNSTYADTVHKEETDLMWLLFNAKFTASWCIFGFPDNRNFTIPRCATPCAPLQLAITSNLSNIGVNSQYDYCSTEMPAPFADSMSQCANCLAYSDSNTILGKFISLLRIACDQRPQVGSKIILSANLFDISLLSSQALVTQGTNKTYAPPTGNANSPMLNTTTSVVVGIIAGFGLAATLLIFFCVARKIRRKRLQKQNEEDGKLEVEAYLPITPKKRGQLEDTSPSSLHEAPSDPVGNIPEMQAGIVEPSDLGITLFSRKGPGLPAFPMRIAPRPAREVHIPPGGLPPNPYGRPLPLPLPPKDYASPPRGVPRRKPVPLRREAGGDQSKRYRAMVSPVV